MALPGREEPDKAVEQQLILITEHARYTEKNDGEVTVHSWNPVRKSISNLSRMLSVGALQLPHELEPPFWIGTGTEERTLIPVANGLLNAVTRELKPHSPDFFNHWALPYDFDPDAGEAKEWLKFLGQLWPDKPDSIALLQEFIGYLLSGEMDQEKIALFHGAKRGGKGTIVKVIIALLGVMNVATPTFASLMDRFGLEPLLSKPLGIISDMRVGGRNIQAAIEILLTVSGRDRSSVNRKNKPALEVQLPTRFLLVSNELYALPDAATALVSRTTPLKFSKTWIGKEDKKLASRLTTPESLSAILNWALTGLDRLHEQGEFTVPEDAEETLAELESLASPEKSWALEHCDFGPGCSDPLETLYEPFAFWASNDQGIVAVPKLSIFAKNLLAAFPELSITRPAADKSEKRPRVYVGIRLRRPHSAAQGGSDPAVSEGTADGDGGFEFPRGVRGRANGKPVHGRSRVGPG